MMRPGQQQGTHRFGEGNEGRELRRADEAGREAVAQRLDEVAEGAASAHPLLHVLTGRQRRLPATACDGRNVN